MKLAINRGNLATTVFCMREVNEMSCVVQVSEDGDVGVKRGEDEPKEENVTVPHLKRQRVDADN
jgi:hypothetical protein